MSRSLRLDRRRFLGSTAAAGALVSAPAFLSMPAIAQSGRPGVSHGLQSGDVGMHDAVVWARADRPASMLVEWATTDSFRDSTVLSGPDVIDATDFTGKLRLTGLPAGQDIFYRVHFRDLADVNVEGEAVVGRLRTAPAAKRDIAFTWSGDTCGQGWGINLDWGGMRGYRAMLDTNPDFFIHSGDTVYCDNPLQEAVELADGSIWRNLMTEEKSKVAETLAEFRGNFKYNLLDENLRAFNAAVPMFAQWDDHEVTNNWFPGRMLDSDDRYTVKSASLLAARAARAFHEYVPIRPNADEPARVYRKIAYGPSLDIFMIDLRSYRGVNGDGMEAQLTPEARVLGQEQMRWLKQELLASNATWKVIASDMPIGLIVWANFATQSGVEAVANGDDGPAAGRELEFADLLRFIHHNDIANTVWLTADVHYTAAHHYSPERAQFQDFAPFWEFVSGPIHAGTFGPNALDMTFGPEVRFQAVPDGVNLPPSAGLQFFGHVAIDGDSEVMTVSLMNIAGETLWSTDLDPA
ncbi:MAG: alkaline phosphatase D family protein [Azospirillaceae bacterium]